MKKKYPIITLCGSTRFKNEFMDAQKELTLRGYIVISVGLFGHAGDEEVWENMDEGTKTKTKMMLDSMHKEKIHMADEIFIINPNGYIGDSTWSEICYARMLGKPIEFMESVDEKSIDAMVEKHIYKAEELAWKQIDSILHSNGYYNIEDYVYFTHKRKQIVDPWISMETHYDGTPWPDHNNPEHAVNPFEYYGQEKVAFFIEEILMRFGEKDL